MKDKQTRQTSPLGDPKLERLAHLLGEFVAKAWLRRYATDVERTMVAEKKQTVDKRLDKGIQ